MAAADHKIVQSRFTENSLSPVILSIHGEAGQDDMAKTQIRISILSIPGIK